MLKLSIAFARSELADTVEEDHAKQACRFFRRTLESMDFTLGDDSFTDVQSSGKTDHEKVKAAVEELIESNDEDLAPIEDIAKETGFPIDRVEDILKRGAKKGEFYDPQSGMWSIP